MATITINLSTFTLTSKWTVTQYGSDPNDLTMTTPTVATHTQDCSYSLPAGAKVVSAKLYVERQWGDTGSRQDKINDSKWDGNEGGGKYEIITNLISGTSGTASLKYTWQANGTTAWGKGNKRASFNYKLVRVTIEYEEGKSTATLSKTDVQADGLDNITATIHSFNASYTHQLQLIVDGVVKQTTASNTVVFSKGLCYYVPNSTVKAATLRLVTFNGDTNIGHNDYGIIYRVPSDVVPSVTLSKSFLNLYQNAYVLKNHSQAILTANASGAYGSTIASYYISGEGNSVNTSVYITPVLKKAGTNTYTVSVVDSRGRTASNTVDFVCTDYELPTGSLEFKRTNSSMNTEPRGTKITAKGNVSVFNIAGNSLQKAELWIKKKGESIYHRVMSSVNTSWALASEDISITDDYNLQFRFRDAISDEQVQNYILPKGAEVLFDFRPDRAGIATKAGQSGALIVPDEWYTNLIPLTKNFSKKFVVGGDPNTYYPVFIRGDRSGVRSDDGIYTICREYNAPAPSSWNNSPTHKGGLTLSLLWTGMTSWSGNSYTVHVLRFETSYASTVAGLQRSASNGLVAYLRGGGAEYKICGQHRSDFFVQVNLEPVTDHTGVTFTPRTDLSNLAAEIKPKF